MANIVQIKRSSVAGKQPNVSDLQVGELALNFADGLIYSKNTTGNIVVVGASTNYSNVKANVTVSASAPSSNQIGDVWINSDTGKEYLWFNDGSSYQWVEENGGLYVSTQITEVAGITLGIVSNAQLAAGITSTGLLNTSNVSEGSNLYFTNTKAVSALTSGYGIVVAANGLLTVTATGSGSSNYTDANVYANVSIMGHATNAQLTAYATASNLTVAFNQANTAFTQANVAFNSSNVRLLTKANVSDLTTANVSEVTNQYFTNARAQAAVANTNIIFANLTTTGNLTIGSAVGGNITGVNFLYATNVYSNVVIANVWSGIYTANVVESTNLYFTNARVVSGITTGTVSNITVSGNIVAGNIRTTSGTITANALTSFIAGDAAISGVALQMPQEGALRNLTNGLTNMYFDVSIGGTTHGQFQFRSGSTFTNVLTMSPTAFNVSTDATVTARTPSLGRLPWNSAIDTELTIDDMRFRISNQGGIYPQVIGNGSSRNLGWTGVGAISGSAVTQVGSTGTIVSSSSWTTLYNSQSMNSAADTVTVTLQDKAAGRIYRITFMRSDNGSTTGYNIIAERIL